MIKNLIQGVWSQEETLKYFNSSIIYETLPSYIYGFVDNYKGINIIYINRELSAYKKKKTILHELAHIELNHLNQIYDFTEMYIENCEDEANNFIKQIKEDIKKEKSREEISN